jgi:hypothetical protein
VHPGDAHHFVDRLVGSGRRERGVARVVELRPRVVRHAPVDRDPRPLRETLHAADAVEGDAGTSDEAASRLEPDLGLRQAGLDKREAGGRRSARRKLGGLGHLVRGMVADPEAAAEIRDARDPTELVATARDERGEADDRFRLGVEVGELRADVDVDAHDVEPEVECLRDGCPRLIGRQAELRSVVTRANRLVRVGVDAERHPHERLPDARGGSKRRLVRSVEDDRGSDRGGLGEQHLGFVVSVDDEVAAPKAGLPRERELAGRRDVGADPL